MIKELFEPENLLFPLITILISFVLTLFFIPTREWCLIISSILVSFLGAIFLVIQTPYYKNPEILIKINDNSIFKNRIAEYLNLRIQHNSSKYNFMVFSLLTYGLILATFFVAPGDTDVPVFQSFCRGFNDIAIYGIFLLLVSGSLFIYLFLSTIFRAKLNRIVEIYLGKY